MRILYSPAGMKREHKTEAQKHCQKLLSQIDPIVRYVEAITAHRKEFGNGNVAWVLTLHFVVGQSPNLRFSVAARPSKVWRQRTLLGHVRQMQRTLEAFEDDVLLLE